MLPVTSADFGRTSMFTSLRTPNSGQINTGSIEKQELGRIWRSSWISRSSNVSAIGMDVGANGMSRAMYKIIAVAFLLDVVAGGAIHFPTGNAASGADCVGDGLHPSVAGVAHNLEYLAHAAGRR